MGISAWGVTLLCETFLANGLGQCLAWPCLQARAPVLLFIIIVIYFPGVLHSSGHWGSSSEHFPSPVLSFAWGLLSRRERRAQSRVCFG